MNLKKLTSWIGKKAPVDITLGVAFDASSLSVSITEPDEEVGFKHKASIYRSISDTQEIEENLKSIVQERSLAGSRVNLALPNTHYKVHQIEKPKVEEDDLKNAVTWAVKDLIEYPINQAVIDYYEVPRECLKGGSEKVNVVCAELEAIKPIVNMIKSSGLEMNAIDIPELALKNLIHLMDGYQLGIGLLYQIHNGVILGIYRENNLLFSRALSGVKNIQDAMDRMSGSVTRDVLLLEIQRTLDFYESQLSQPPLQAIYIQPLIVDAGVLIEYLVNNLNPNIACLDLNQLILSLENITKPVQYGCMKSIGAAYRVTEE